MASRISPVHCISYSNLCLPCQYLVLSVYCDFQITHIQLYSLKIDCQLHKKFLCRKPLVRSFESTYRSKVALMPREQHPANKKPRDISISGVPNKYANVMSHSQNPLLGIFIPACKVMINGHTFGHLLEPVSLLSLIYTRQIICRQPLFSCPTK